MENRLSGIIPEQIVRKYNIIPSSIKNERLEILASNFDPIMVQELMMFTGLEVYIKETEENEIKKIISSRYDGIQGDDNDAVDRLNMIIETAICKNASDIHIEPYKNYCRVRLRMDGDLLENLSLDLNMYQLLATVIKIKAGLDITEKRKPQDGRIEFCKDEYEIDLRVSVIPVIDGEKIVMRLLNRSGFLLSRKDIGFSSKANSMIDKMLVKQTGMIIISGPTGSGKTTTMYALINELKKRKNNITTIEDPVEYRIEGINQVLVNEKQGLSFEKSLRAILRQDPDIIVVGEIRDSETAKIAISAANSGHLVISSLHTTDSISTISRLIDMGVEDYMVNSSVRGVICQRLIKSRQLLNNFSSGRRIIYEILIPGENFKEGIRSNLGKKDLKKIALKEGMIDFEQSIRSLDGNMEILSHL